MLEGCCPIHIPQNGAPCLGRVEPLCFGDHMGTMQGPHRNHPWIISLPFSHPLLVSHLLPGNKDCLSAPHSTISTWVQTRGWLRAWGFFATSFPCLMLYRDHYSSAFWESPIVKTCFPLLTFLPFSPGLPSSPGLPWQEKKGSEGAPQALHQPGAPAARSAWAPLEPQGAWKGELGIGRALPDGSSWDLWRAGDRMCP